MAECSCQIVRCCLKFAAMNLKKLAKRKWKERYPSYLICFELLISNYLRKNPSFAQAKLGFLDSLRQQISLLPHQKT